LGDLRAGGLLSSGDLRAGSSGDLRVGLPTATIAVVVTGFESKMIGDEDIKFYFIYGAFS
jgi:hypothetical protein